MGKIICICVGAVIVWVGTILLMHQMQKKKIKKMEVEYQEKQRVQQKLQEEYSVKVQNKQAKIAALQSQTERRRIESIKKSDQSTFFVQYTGMYKE